MLKLRLRVGEMTHGRCQRKEWALPARAKKTFAYQQMTIIAYRQITTTLRADDVHAEDKHTAEIRRWN